MALSLGQLDPPSTPHALLEDAKRALLSTLPRGWFVSSLTSENARANVGFDAQLTIESPGYFTRSFQLELKTNPKRRDLAELLGAVREGVAPQTETLLIARFLSPNLRAELEQREISFVDATGNVFIHSVDPAIFIRRDGANADPWRGPGRPVGSLKGLPAARLVRALADFTPPYTMPQLAKLSGASPGATYRLIDFLEQEALVERELPRVTSVRWSELLRRWSEETDGLSPNSTGTGFIEPRGAQEVLRKLRAVGSDEYVISGSVAAGPYYSYAEARLVTLYANKPIELAKKLGWRRVESGANVIIAAPRSPVVFDRTTAVDGLRRVSPSQAAVDLLNGPGRQPAEGEALLEWMASHEDEWRRQPNH